MAEGLRQPRLALIFGTIMGSGRTLTAHSLKRYHLAASPRSAKFWVSNPKVRPDPV